MLLKQMIANDLKNCYEAASNDALLQSLESDFYAYRAGMDRSDFARLEEIFSEYMARVSRLAYLQGMKDFHELCLELKENTNDIMKKYIDA
jgi:hypothetical protein